MAMAARDDKISNNRRRLFKALSAAPVVATLQPGQALANASNLQCLDNTSKPITKLWYRTKGHKESSGPAYKMQYYYDPTAADGGGTADSSYTCPTLLQGPIVEIDNKYFNLDGDNVTSYITPSLHVSNAINLLDGARNVCHSGVMRKEGLFLVVVVPEDSSGKSVYGSDPNAVTARIVGVYPQKDPTSWKRQGIYGTCMASATGGAVPDDWWLKG